MGLRVNLSLAWGKQVFCRNPGGMSTSRWLWHPRWHLSHIAAVSCGPFQPSPEKGLLPQIKPRRLQVLPSFVCISVAPSLHPRYVGRLAEWSKASDFRCEFPGVAGRTSLAVLLTDLLTYSKITSGMNAFSSAFFLNFQNFQKKKRYM